MRFGVKYFFSDYYHVATLSLDTGKKPKPVSNFEELLLLVQILFLKCENMSSKKTQGFGAYAFCRCVGIGQCISDPMS